MPRHLQHAGHGMPVALPDGGGVVSNSQIRRMKKQAAKRAALGASRLQGCRCPHPDVEVHGTTGPLFVKHDRGCPCLGLPRTLVVYNEPGRCER
ncbi:MAG: hypothetical protein R2690_21490 [Acidimicrobiales bacterium]